MTIIYNKNKPNQYKIGGSIVNSLINKLPFELHLPGGYQFCGPGTKLAERLARGDKGINPLDAACREHDIIYSQTVNNNKENLEKRHQADNILAEKAWGRVKAKDSTFKEKSGAWFVSNAMKAKVKFGLGMTSSTKKRNRKNKKKKKLVNNNNGNEK